MIHKELLNFIEEFHYGKGHSKEDLWTALVSHGGWNHEDIKEAFRIIELKKQKTKHHRVAMESAFRTRVLEPVVEVKKPVEAKIIEKEKPREIIKTIKSSLHRFNFSHYLKGFGSFLEKIWKLIKKPFSAVKNIKDLLPSFNFGSFLNKIVTFVKSFFEILAIPFQFVYSFAVKKLQIFYKYISNIEFKKEKATPHHQVLEKRSVDIQEIRTAIIAGVSKLPSFREIFVKTLRLYRKRFFILTGLALIPTFIISLASFAPQDVFVNHPNFSLIVYILFAFFSFVVFSAILHALKKENYGFVDSYVKGFLEIIPLAWVMLLTLFIISGGYLFSIELSVFFIAWLGNTTTYSAIILITLFVVLVSLMAFLILSPFIVVNEKVRGVEAILKSCEYFITIGVPLWRRVLVGGAIFFLVVSLPGFVSNESIKNIFDFITSVVFIPLGLVYLDVVYKSVSSVTVRPEFFHDRRHKIVLVLIGLSGYILPIFVLSIVNSWLVSSETRLILESILSYRFGK
ncbi:MAG: hypothetical protein WCO84_05135 [bacterium]